MGGGGADDDVAVVLLVEDDDGDALLVSELLSDAAVTVDLRRVRSLAEAQAELGCDRIECVLLDLGLPDADGIDALERLRAHTAGRSEPPAFVVLTGHAEAELGARAVAAGADDYLAKGETDPQLLGRSLRYALQRRHAETQRRALFRSEVRAAETARLERALLPTPLVADTHVSVMVGYLPGRDGLLGGDFFDTVERPDGTVLSVIGDVAGHGPDEAALGATLRTAWRTLVLTGTPPGMILGLLERVLVAERTSADVFVTLCLLVVEPDRSAVEMYLAGHPAPLLITGPAGSARCTEVEPSARGRALGIPVVGGWQAQRLSFDGPFAVVLYTDGLVEAVVAPQDADAVPARGRPRLGVGGLRRVFDEELADEFSGVVERVLRRVRELHGGPLADDAAVLSIGWTADDRIVGERSSTLADTIEWAR